MFGGPLGQLGGPLGWNDSTLGWVGGPICCLQYLESTTVSVIHVLTVQQYLIGLTVQANRAI
jgi:hypothetical protein